MKKEKVYISPAWWQHADLIQQLKQYNQPIVLLTAPPGGGKTTFFHALHTLPSKELCKAFIRIQEGETCASLMKKVTEGFGIPWEEGIQALLSDLSENKEALFVLFVDDAQLLQKEVLTALLDLIQFDMPPNAQLHLVLFGEPVLEQNLLSPQWSAITYGKVIALELDPWSLQDIKNYYAQYTSTSDRLPPLSQDALRVLFERTQGLPALVTKEIMAQGKQAKGKKLRQMLTRFAYPSIFHPVSIGVMGGVLLGLTYLIFNHTSEEGVVTMPINIAQVSEHEWEADASVSAQTQKPPSVNTSIQPRVGGLQGDAQKAQKNEVQLEKAITAQNTHSVQTLEQTSSVRATGHQATASTQKAQSSTLKSLQENEQHLLSANQSHYTLQLLGARKEANVKQFIQQHALTDKTYYFKSHLAGADWYVVVYGEYSSKEAAKAAMERMPSSVKQQKITPWVREFKSVQEDIKAKNALK